MLIAKLRYVIIVILFTAIVIGGLYTLYSHWQLLLSFSQQWQRQFHASLTLFLMQVKSAPLRTSVLLIGLSFLYGVLHSAGPGHGKVIITTYLATQPSKLKKSLLLTLCSAIMQGIIAIVLVSSLLILFNLSTKQLKNSEYWLELMSYILIIFIGVYLCLRAVKKIYLLFKTTHISKPSIIAIRMLPAKSNMIPPNHHYNNNHCACACACGHRHLPTADELSQSKHWYSDLAIICAIGMRPCSGALLVLVFSYAIDVYSWGIVATLAMSMGTALTTSLFALFVYCARKLAARFISRSSQHRNYSLKLTSHLIAIIGGLLFMAMGLLLSMGMELQRANMINPVLG